jgi:hypothetical protein
MSTELVIRLGMETKLEELELRSCAKGRMAGIGSLNKQ